ncbi:MAG: TlpA disulfide reductase family protein [Planktomarina sp.]
MKKLVALTTAVALIAIGAWTFMGAEDATPIRDTSALEALKTGDMRKLQFSAAPAPAAQTPFFAEDGSELTMANYEGKVVVLNFWATWCAPCRKEMPHLQELQAELGGDNFEVVTIATGRNEPAAMKAFFDEIRVDNLPLHRDPKSALARQSGVLGLPVTLILDREGNELARLQGDADWASDSAKTIIVALVEK